MKKKKYISLDKLEVYKLARKLGKIAWRIYKKLDWRTKKIMGDQFIESSDSVAANIAEGYGRYHYLDKVKFYYNARGSLLESRNWFDLLKERKFLEEKNIEDYLGCYKELRPALNALINSTFKAKES